MTESTLNDKQLSPKDEYPEWYYHPEAVFNPSKIAPLSQIIFEEVDTRNRNCIIAFGEADHHNAGALEYERELVEKLREKYGARFKGIFLEENREMQPLVRDFETTGVLPERLEKYLLEEFLRLDQRSNNYKLQLVKKCKELGIPVHFIDVNRYRYPQEDKEWVDSIQKVIGERLDGIYLLIAGATHVRHIPKNNGDPTAVLLLDHMYGPNSLLSVSVSPMNELVNQECPENTLTIATSRGFSKHGFTNDIYATRTSDFQTRGVWECINDQQPVEKKFDIVATAPGEDLLPSLEVRKRRQLLLPQNPQENHPEPSEEEMSNYYKQLVDAILDDVSERYKDHTPSAVRINDKISTSLPPIPGFSDLVTSLRNVSRWQREENGVITSSILPDGSRWRIFPLVTRPTQLVAFFTNEARKINKTPGLYSLGVTWIDDLYRVEDPTSLKNSCYPNYYDSEGNDYSILWQEK